jgi:hypothetical protein
MSRSSFFAGAARPTVALVACAVACTFVVGCGLLKKKNDAGTDEQPPANAPTVTVTGSGAKNEKDVLRYASETKIAEEPATVGKDGVKARTFPASGAEVATLSKGTTVVKIAKFFSTAVLVLFDDPTTADGTKLMGWIPPEALAAPAATGATAAPVFTAPKVVVDAGPKDAGGVADAGPKDAGGVADAGATADAGKAAADAGSVAVGTITALPTNGKCPAGMILFGPLCRKPCTSDADCKGAFCVSSGGKKTCAATK